MKNNLTPFIIFIFLFLYISSILSFGIPLLLLVMSSITGYYFVTARLRQTLNLFSCKELIIIILCFFIYLIFSQRKSIWDVGDRNIFKIMVYALQHIIVLYLLAAYGLKNLKNAITLTRSFSLLLLFSFFFFNVGMIFPDKFIELRQVLYGKYYEQLVELGLFNISPILFAGFTPEAYLFGYQVAGGFLIISLFLSEMERVWKLIWAIGIIFVIATLIVLAERSVVLAFVAGFVSLVFLIPKKRLTYKKVLLIPIVIVLFLFISIFGVYKLSVYLENTNLPVNLLHKRLGQSDIPVRIGMQIAAIEIIVEKPLGLYVEGMREEDWGKLANEKGYEVVTDADNESYALVHNGYLRIIMYFGWVIGLGIIIVFIFILTKIKTFKCKGPIDECVEKKYGRAVYSTLVALLVQAMFHNDSLFTFEKTTWITFCLFMIWVKLSKTNLKRNNMYG